MNCKNDESTYWHFWQEWRINLLAFLARIMDQLTGILARMTDHFTGIFGMNDWSFTGIFGINDWSTHWHFWLEWQDELTGFFCKNDGSFY